MSQAAEPAICIYRDAAELATHVADFIIASAGAAVRDRGRFTLALTGGSTPEKAYQTLAEPGRASRIDWAKTYLFLGDERVVPYDDPRSNYGMARRTLISRVPVPPANLYPMPTDRITPQVDAIAYAEMLVTAFQQPADGPPPRFDLILLGLGEDGHVASLFPHKPTLDETRAWVVSSPPGTLPPPVDRVTVTFPVLNAARAVLFIVGGEKKAVPVQDVLVNNPDYHDRPAAGVRPTDGRVTWMLDEAAAALLNPQAFADKLR
jgi:6-phosphogluconolactonase